MSSGNLLSAFGGGLDIVGDYYNMKSQKSILKAQASLYSQSAEDALYVGRENVKKTQQAGEQAQGEMIAGFGASGVDVNNSQTVDNAQRVLQSGVNDDVYSTMYSAANQANQYRASAQIAKYQAKQLSTNFSLSSLGKVAAIGALFL